VSDERWNAVAEERLALADALEAIDLPAWEEPSRCERWAVRDVVAHLVYLAEGSRVSILVGGALIDPRPSRSVEKAAGRIALSSTPDELLTRLRKAAGGRFVVPGLPPGGGVGGSARPPRRHRRPGWPAETGGRRADDGRAGG